MIIKHQFFFAAAVAVCTLLPALIFAEGETISLEQARTLALANSRTLAKYNLKIQSAMLAERSQLFSNFPSPSLGASASMSLWNSGGRPLEDPVTTFSTGLNFSVSQKIFEGGKSLLLQSISELATESGRKDALAEYFNVLDSADSVFYAVLEAAAALEAEKSSLETAEVSLSMAEIRQAGGMINQGDYLKALADKESKEAAFNKARRTLALNTAKLRALIGLDAVPALRQIDFGEYQDLILRLGTVSDAGADFLYAELWKLAAAANPSLAKAGIAGRTAEKNLSLAKRDFSPSLSASFSTGLNYSPNAGMELSSGRISISGSIPLDFWTAANRVARSKIDRDAALLDYAGLESSLETELQTALLNAIDQASSALSAARALEYAEKHFEYIMERYRLSQSSVSELSDASVLASSSQSQLIKARYGFLRSLSSLRSLGAVDDEEKLMNLLRGGAP
jgi:outer membrane protein